MREWQRKANCPCIPDEWAPKWYAAGPEGKDLTDGVMGCPGAHARAQVAVEVDRALGWWERGQLALIYPTMPEVVTCAVDFARSVRSEFQAEGRRREDAERRRNNG